MKNLTCPSADPVLRVVPLAVIIAALFAAPVTLAQFAFADRDVLLTVRKAGATSSLVVDLGSDKQFDTAPAGSTLNLGVVPGLISTFGPNLSGIQFSFLGTVRNADNADAANPQHTLFASRLRGDLNSQTTPWNTQSATAQATAGGKIFTLGNSSVGAGLNSNFAVFSAGDTSHGINRWVGSGISGGGSVGNLNGTWQAGGTPEGKAPDVFLNGDYLRSDFYRLVPSSGEAGYIGTFELSGAGALSFSTSTVPEPSEFALVAVGLAGGLVVWAQRRLRSV